MSSELTFQTAGLDAALLDAIRKISPLSGFTHTFQSFDSLEELNRRGPKLAKGPDVVVLVDEAATRSGTGRLLPHLGVGPTEKREKRILCAGDFSALTEDELAGLYDLWVKPMAEPVLRFRFMRLLEHLKGEMDSWRYQDYQRRILEMARQDCLTGLATRWYFQEYVEENREELMTCVYFDLDHFKELNDTYGHQAGDAALAATAEMMQREFPDGFLARLGGDEFMAVLLGRRPIDEVERRVNLFLENLMRYYRETDTMRGLTVSAGISQGSPERVKSIDQLIHESDRALYRAKDAGRACCRVYEPSMERPAGNRTVTESSGAQR